MAHKQHKFTSHSSRGEKSEIRASARVAEFWWKSPLLGCRLPTSHCAHKAENRVGKQLSSDSYKGTNPIHEDTAPMTLLNPTWRVSKECSPSDIFLGQWGSRQISNLQNCKIINVCCFKPLDLCWLVTAVAAAIETKYTCLVSLLALIPPRCLETFSASLTEQI